MTEAPTSVQPQRTSFLAVAAVFSLTVLLALATHRACMNVFLTDDALILPFMMALLEKAQFSFAQYVNNILLYPWAGNYHPLWLVQAEYQYRWFGMNETAWQAANAIFHATSATLVFVWLRRILGSWTGPLLAATLWASTVGGFRDDPAMVIFEAHYPLALIWLLAGMILAHESIRSGRRMWTFLGCVCLSIAIGTWEVALLGIPTLALQYFLLPRSLGKKIDWISIFLWGATFLLNGGMIAYVLLQGPPSPSMVHGRPILTIGSAFSWHLVEAASSLLAFDPQDDVSSPLKIGILVATFVFCLLLKRRHWLALLFLSGMPLGTIAAVCVLRREELLYSGDYLYYVLFFISVLVGMVGDALYFVAGRFRKVVSCLLVVGSVFLWIHQARKAETMVEKYRGPHDEVRERWEANRNLVEQIVTGAPASAGSIELPNIPITLQPHLSITYFLEQFVAIERLGEKYPSLKVVTFDRISEERRLALVEQLRQIDAPIAKQWVETLDVVVPELRSILWVSQRLKDEGKKASIPFTIEARYPNLGLVVRLENLSNCLADLGPSVSVSEESLMFEPGELRELERLTHDPSPEGKSWAALFQRLYYMLGTQKLADTLTPSNP